MLRKTGNSFLCFFVALLAVCALAQNEPAEDRLAERDAFAKRQVRTALEQARRGKSELLWPLLRHSSDPSARSYLVRDLGKHLDVLEFKTMPETAAGP